MKGLDSTQTEQLKQIAEYLYDQRQEQGIPLEKIAQDTFIPLRLLQAIDSAQFERLPEPVYVRGFIRRYADALGLDGSEIADAFDIEPAPLAEPAAPLPAPQPQLQRIEPMVEPRSEQPQPLVEPVNESDDAVPRYERAELVRDRESRPSYLPWVIAGGAAIAVVGLIAIGMSQFKRPTPSASTPSAALPSSPAPTESSAPAPKQSDAAARSLLTGPCPGVTVGATASPVASASPSPGAAADLLQVDIKLLDPAWIEIVADGKEQCADTIPKGEHRTWTAKKNLMIRVGDAGAVMASYNGSEAKLMGKRGDVVQMDLPKP